MYDFAVVALIALATLKLVDFLTDSIELLRPVRSLLTFVVAIAAVYALDFSLFREWGVSIRNDGSGVLLTGFVVAGMTVCWRAIFSYLTHDRAALDETLGEPRHHIKAA